MSIDPTVFDQPSATQVTEGFLETPKPPREPLDPEHRAWLIGLLAGGVILGIAVASWVALSGANNTRKAKEKTDQVTACTKIEDGTAALACVVQIDQ
jgi:hypothetical protein